jgi:hypothetical protein
MHLKIKGIPESRLKECKDMLVDGGWKYGVVILDRAIPLSLRESIPLDVAIRSIIDLLPHNVMDYKTLKILSYNPLCICGWSDDRKTYYISMSAGMFADHISILSANTREGIAKIRGDYVNTLMRRAKAIRNSK